MEVEQWRKKVVEAVETNNEKQVDLIAINLKEAEDAKQLLRDKGFGFDGLSLLEIIKREL